MEQHLLSSAAPLEVHLPRISFNQAHPALGVAALRALQIPLDDHTTYVVHNFIPGPTAKGEPTALVPHPMGDAYLNFLAVPCLGERERAICLPLAPGVERYFRDIGLLHRSNQVEEVPFLPSRRLGHWSADPLALAARHGMKLVPHSRVLAAFCGSGVAAYAEAMGGSSPQLGEALMCNNKGHMRSYARRYGISMAPGIVMRDRTDLEMCVALFDEGTSRVWLKLDRGSGGDMVLPLDGPLTRDRLLCGLTRLRQETHRALFHEGYSKNEREAFWATGHALPVGAEVIAEADASIFGRVGRNCSSSLLIYRDGTFETLGYFRQRTGPSGDYRGSEPLDVHGELRMRFQAQMAAVAKYCASELGYAGIAGVDFMEVEGPDGTVSPVVIELNGRPPISATAAIIAGKLGAQSWINLNIWAPRELATVEDFERAVTTSTRQYARGDASRGMVALQALRSLYTLTPDGERRLWRPTNAAKVLVCGSNTEHTESILKDLEEHGIKFTS